MGLCSPQQRKKSTMILPPINQQKELKRFFENRQSRNYVIQLTQNDNIKEYRFYQRLRQQGKLKIYGEFRKKLQHFVNWDISINNSSFMRKTQRGACNLGELIRENDQLPELVKISIFNDIIQGLLEAKYNGIGFMILKPEYLQIKRINFNQKLIYKLLFPEIGGKMFIKSYYEQINLERQIHNAQVSYRAPQLYHSPQLNIQKISKADIWSAGAILIEMITRSVFSRYLSQPIGSNSLVSLQYQFLLMSASFQDPRVQNNGNKSIIHDQFSKSYIVVWRVIYFMMLIYRSQNRIDIDNLYRIWQVLGKFYISQLQKSKGRIPHHLVDNNVLQQCLANFSQINNSIRTLLAKLDNDKITYKIKLIQYILSQINYSIMKTKQKFKQATSKEISQLQQGKILQVIQNLTSQRADFKHYSLFYEIINKYSNLSNQEQTTTTKKGYDKVLINILFCYATVYQLRPLVEKQIIHRVQNKLHISMEQIKIKDVQITKQQLIEMINRQQRSIDNGKLSNSIISGLKKLKQKINNRHKRM